MTGKDKGLIIGIVVVGVAFGYFAKRSFDANNMRMSGPENANLIQYIHRLKEFFITKDSLTSAEQEFHDFIEMGFSPFDSFEMTITRRPII